MKYVEVEIKAKTVDLAIEAAMQELGVEDREMLAVEIVQEPEKGFLGFGGQDAVIKARRRNPRKRRRNGAKRQDSRGRNQERRPRGRHEAGDSGNNGGKTQGNRKSKDRKMESSNRKPAKTDDRAVLEVDEQARIVQEFLDGLLNAYGLEGAVSTRAEDDVIVADVSGEQTEALVGVRGSVRSAIHELTRTVMQRYTQDTARLRLDIAGYAEKRRQALTIYAEQLIGQLKADGGEIMLEPMSAADRKVIHDVAADHDGISSYSEGESPRRYVVLANETTGDEEE